MIPCHFSQQAMKYLMQPTLMSKSSNPYWIDILFLALILGGLFFIFLGERPLFTPDEGRYAEIAREMVVSGDYITPRLNHIKYFEKPILFYWLESAAIHLTGLSIWSVRSVNALISLFGCLFTYSFIRKLYGRTAGLMAAFIMGTSLLYFVMAHMVSLDLPVTVLIAATLYFFLLGILEPYGRTRRIYLWAASASSACAVLTKGLIGIVLPVMIITAWIAILNEWRLLKQVYLPSCLFIFILIAAPWHILVANQNPEFFYFYFIQQHFLRYTMKEVGHYQPTWFFIPILFLGFFPWIMFLPQALKNAFPKSWKRRNEYKIEIFFLLWISIIFIFFSFSKSKLIPYILPVFPPLAILIARYFQLSIANQTNIKIKKSYVCLLITSILIAIVFFFLPPYIFTTYPQTAVIYLNLASATLVIGSCMALFFSYRKYIYSAIITTIVMTWFFLLLLLSALPYLDTRSIASLTNQLKLIIHPQDDIVTYNQYYQDLPFYLERRITILNWKNELSFGMKHQNTKAWMINDEEFKHRWYSQQRVFALMSFDEYEKFKKKYPDKPIYLIGKSNTNILISNMHN